MRILILSLTLLFPLISSAEILIQSIQGYSKIRNFFPGATSNSIQLYGGYGGGTGAEGRGSCANKNNTTTCNDCTGSDYQICNETRVYPDLRLTFSFSSTTLAQGTPTISVQNSVGIDTRLTLVNPAPITTQSNQLVTVSVTWFTLRQAIINAANASGGAPDCVSAPCEGTILVGLDASSNGLSQSDDDALSVRVTLYEPPPSMTTVTQTTPGNTSCSAGLCNYTLFPGDKKAYLRDLSVANPPAGRPITGLIFICAEGNTDPVDFGSVILPSYAPNLRRVQVQNGSILEESIEGFQNGVRYYCRASVEDDTGNILLFNDKNGTQDTVCPNAGDTSCHTVRPDEVIGLFAEEMNCFIATAAYGSLWEPEVETLRQFRSRILLKTSLGKKFVSWYYREAPPMAQWIAESPTRRLGARVLLTPVFVGAYLAMNWPWALVLTLLSLLVMGLWRWNQQEKAQ